MGRRGGEGGRCGDGCDIGVGQSECPTDRLEVHLLDCAVVPGAGIVAERGVVDPSLPVHLRPDQREVRVLVMHERVILHLEMGDVEAENDVGLGA